MPPVKRESPDDASSDQTNMKAIIIIIFTFVVLILYFRIYFWIGEFKEGEGVFLEWFNSWKKKRNERRGICSEEERDVERTDVEGQMRERGPLEMVIGEEGEERSLDVTDVRNVMERRNAGTESVEDVKMSLKSCLKKRGGNKGKQKEKSVRWVDDEILEDVDLTDLLMSEDDTWEDEEASEEVDVTDAVM
ncbi:hypothetical protein SBOR_3829 [Sclerotinia borealis F-4128]|uniref:Uncharacterized protein n=1 Tax=Sclerotinia borealis (strain F-4128) TaxID=1432307 RepID=W9CGH6_SCLBF|nr:hypothetical protein SBOR_3829 [Sclerotinia borealis F-4128]